MEQMPKTAWKLSRGLETAVPISLSIYCMRKLEMRVDALEEAVIHIGTELQALKVKMRQGDPTSPF